MGLQLLPDGKLLVIGGKLMMECCCEETTTHPAGDCDSFPLEWRAVLSGLLSKAVGSLALGSIITPYNDPSSRVYCEHVPPPGSYIRTYGANDWTAFNGSYVLPYNGLGSWGDNLGTLGVGWGEDGGTPPEYVITGSFTANLNIDVSMDDCFVGPGDVTVTAGLSIPVGLSSISAATWTKTITLLTGQKLRDVGAITMDATNKTWGSSVFGSPNNTYNFSINSAICRPSDGAIATSTPSLVLIPL